MKNLNNFDVKVIIVYSISESSESITHLKFVQIKLNKLAPNFANFVC